MATLTVRNVPYDVHRTTEAGVRENLPAVVKPEKRVHMGDALAAIGREIGLTNEDAAVLENVRDKTPAEPLSLD